ncbi:unnamed protein product [Colias eurytheme]|nr:unnamed protein product [Colias eurytheme]
MLSIFSRATNRRGYEQRTMRLTQGFELSIDLRDSRGRGAVRSAAAARRHCKPARAVAVAAVGCRTINSESAGSMHLCRLRPRTPVLAHHIFIYVQNLGTLIKRMIWLRNRLIL